MVSVSCLSSLSHLSPSFSYSLFISLLLSLFLLFFLSFHLLSLLSLLQSTETTSSVIRTSRHVLLSSTSGVSLQDRELYATLRFTVLEFLVFCNNSLLSFNSSSVSRVVSTAAGTGSTFSGLFDSAIIQVLRYDFIFYCFFIFHFYFSLC